jgi:cold shock CspA family protein
MPELYVRVSDVNQRVEFGRTQGWKGAQAEHARGP